MTAALALPPPPRGLRLRASDLLYTRRGLLLLALLGPALLWFGIVYLGALFTLLANAFFGLDDFTGQVVRELTLRNFVALADRANVDAALRTVTMAACVPPILSCSTCTGSSWLASTVTSAPSFLASFSFSAATSTAATLSPMARAYCTAMWPSPPIPTMATHWPGRAPVRFRPR